MGNVTSSNQTVQDIKKLNVKNAISCEKSECSPGFKKGKGDICYTGWSASCGEGCARNNCYRGGGTWVPANYNESPFLCKINKKIFNTPLTLYKDNSFNGQSECFPKEGKYNCKLNEVKSVKIDNNYLAVLYSSSGLTGSFVSTYENTSGKLLNVKSVALINQDVTKQIVLSSEKVKKVGPNFYLKHGLYPSIENITIGSYTISSANPYYSKQPNDGIMFYSDEIYNGKSFYLGKNSPTSGQAKMGFKPKSMMVFKADKIYFYQDSNLRGGEIPMEVKAYPNLEEEFRTNKNDITKSSSISIPERRIAFLYTEANFKGKKIILSAGGYNLPAGWNDHVKSAQFLTLDELKKYQVVEFNKARNQYLNQNPSLTKFVKITPGWENTEFNLIAKNSLGGGSCASKGKLTDIGLFKTTPEKFVLDFYAGLLTRDEAENYAKEYNVPYFGYVVNSGNDITLKNIKPNQKLHYFGGFTINSTYTDELRKMNKKQKEWANMMNKIFMPQSVFGTNLHVFEVQYTQQLDTQICNKFVDKANEMNQYALEMNQNSCTTLYSEKNRILTLQKKL